MCEIEQNKLLPSLPNFYRHKGYPVMVAEWSEALSQFQVERMP